MKYYRHTIEEIQSYFCVVIYIITIVYYPTHIYRKGWLTNRLSLPIILNLVSESSSVKTLLSLLPTVDLLSPSPRWTLLLLLPFPLPNQRYSPAGQPLKSCCRWFFLPPAAAITCRAKPWFLLSCFCRPSSHHEDNNSFYRCVVQHSSSGLIETYDHQLCLLANADEVISF